jgi:hypothetical protein
MGAWAFGLCLYLLLSAPKASAYFSGPPPGRTGAPGDEGTCQFCHFSYPLNDPSGGIAIGGLPKAYQPGEPIQFLVTVFQDGTDGARIDWGFELTVLDVNEAFAGTLLVTDTENTQVIPSDDGTRCYIEHTAAGTFYNPEGAEMATWTVTWIPPDKDIGPVTFYAAGNAGNGDLTQIGDYIFTTSQTVMAAVPPD